MEEWKKSRAMEINLRLTQHCIETGARMEFERLVRQYFNKSTSESKIAVLEERLEMLKIFLERADFKSLRSRYPVLNGDHDTKVTLKFYPKEDRVTILSEGKDVCSIKL